MRGLRNPRRVGAIITVVAVAIVLGGYIASGFDGKRGGGTLPVHADRSVAVVSTGSAPESFSGSCESASGLGQLAADQLGSYEAILSGLTGSVEALAGANWPHCAIAVTVRANDYMPSSSSKTNRTEFSAPHTLWRTGQSVWYALSFRMTSGSPLPRNGAWMVVDQFFAQDLAAGISGGSPPVSLEITSTGQVRLHVRAGAKSGATTSAPLNHSYWIAPVLRGSWHDLLIHVRWSTGSDGLVSLWRRTSSGAFTSTPQLSVNGPDLLTVAGDVLPVYAETGIYRSSSPTLQTVDYGGLWARSTRAEAEGFFARNPS